MSRLARYFVLVCLAASTSAQTPPQSNQPPTSQPPPAASIAARTAQLKKNDGFIPFYWDAKRGELLFELSPAALQRRALYFTALGSGIGSLELFADRSSFGASSAVVRFLRVGPRVLVVQENTAFRAENGTPELKRSVELSFPTSVLAALPIEAEQDGAVLVNANPLVVRDAFDLLGQIRRPARAIGGDIVRQAAPAAASWRLDEPRSVVDMEHTRAFPLNTELEALLTFASDSSESALNQPDARAVTVRQHQSLVALPEPGFEIRERDPRVGFFGVRFQDFSQPYNQPLVRTFVERWRLQKKDPSAANSEPVKPITFYLDPAIPEPVRSAARRGALWWNDAFEQAGFRNALRIEDLPAGADPLDVRYPTIQWTNRSGRGWSVGQTQADPRTGEIVHAVVQLDSHRMRTVHNFWDAALLPRASRSEASADADAFDLFAALDGADPQLAEEQVMLNRLALLTCHEMGHVLGLEHNFAASTFGRGSVMEYYAPRIKVRADGTADLSDAYQQGVGIYDKFAIEWGYSLSAATGPTAQAAAQERARLDQIVQRALAKGIFWANYADPRWNAYDDGPDPVTWLKQVVPVRDALLKHYGPQLLRSGEPWSDLAARFPLVYLFHQYGLAAAVNVVGSATIPLSLKGDGQQPVTPWPAAAQREALKLALAALAPAQLDISPELWRALAPPENQPGSPERFRSSAGYLFDPGDGARAVAEIVVGGLLQPARIQRLLLLPRQDPQALAAEEVVRGLVNAGFGPAPKTPFSPSQLELAGAVQSEIAERLMRLAVDDAATSEVQAVAWRGVEHVQRALATMAPTAMTARLQHEIELFRRDPRANVPRPRLSGAPPGPPI